MPKPPLGTSLLRSRFGRRLFGLFVICSLLPTGLLALISFGTVTRQLRESSIVRLTHTGDQVGRAIVERLRMLNEDLARVTGRATPCPAAATWQDGPACDEAFIYWLSGLTFVPEGGVPVAMFGPPVAPLSLNPPVGAPADPKRGWVVSGVDTSGRPIVHLVRPAANGGPRGLLVAEINLHYLTGDRADTPLLPTMVFHLADDSARIILGSELGAARIPDEVRAELASTRSGSFEWTLGETSYLAVHRPFSPAEGPALPGWRVVVSEDRNEVVGPMQAFRRDFPLVIALGLMAALLLSLWQLRRSLTPLAALHEGTRRVARQQFGEPVVVTTTCEFGEVATSFNTMADQIHTQLDALRRLAYFDTLTGLPNRASFTHKLTTELERNRAEGDLVGVLLLDLDHFSRINDTLGHRIGDFLVQDVSNRVTTCCNDLVPGSQVARLGGDEFTVIVPGLTESRTAVQLAERLLEAFAAPFSLDGHEVVVSTSIGISFHPIDGSDIESLLKHADAAMYQAKRKGRNRYEVYAAALTAGAVERLTLEHQLRQALELDQFALWYQPIVDLKTGRITSAEALIRWHHPEWGIVPPGEFIPLCEERGLIVPIGEWSLRALCAQSMAWQRQGLPVIPIANNLSGQQLQDPDTVGLVQRVLRETGLDPGALIIELTESILMEGGSDAWAAVQALSELGVGLAIDDFGTGYSSLSYLKQFPVQTLKIDRSFISNITTDPDDAAITRAVIALGQALGLRTVAEGVETEEQAEYLRRQGCDAMQGYLIGRPVPAPAFATYLRGPGLMAPARG